MFIIGAGLRVGPDEFLLAMPHSNDIEPHKRESLGAWSGVTAARPILALEAV